MIDVRLAWDRPARPPDRKTRHVLLVGLTPKSDVARLPADICIALDCSGSMDPTKLGAAQAACRLAYECLGAADRIALITYNSRPTLRLAPATKQQIGTETLQKHLAAIRAVGLTRTELALEMARDVLADKLGPDRATAVVLITDGFPTDENGQNRAESEFDDFYTLAERLAAQGISLITVGLGSARNYHRPFLTELADRGQGRFCYAPKAEMLAPLLSDEIHRAQSTVSVGVEIDLKPRQPGVRVSGACAIAPHFRPITIASQADGGRWRLACGALPAGSEPTESVFLVAVDVEGLFGVSSGVQPVLEVSVSWSSPDGTRGATAAAQSLMNYTLVAREQEEINEEVDGYRARWEMIRCQEEASRAANPARATQLLSQVAQRAGALGLVDFQRHTQRQIAELRRTGRMDQDETARSQQWLRASGSSQPQPVLFDAGLGFGGGPPLLLASPSTPAGEPLLPDAAALVVVEGRQPGQRFDLASSPLILGRDDADDGTVDVDLAPQDNPDGPTVSRRHAQLAWRDGSLWLVDLGSVNGTRVGDKRLPSGSGGQPAEPYQLRDGDLISLGAVRLRVAAK